MPCYSPLQAWRGGLLPSGKREIVFKRPGNASECNELQLPCGQCIGCRLERSRQWAMRCVDEASLYKENCFITLTYEDSKLPLGGSLEIRDYQLFMKRLRKWLESHDADGKDIPKCWQSVLVRQTVRYFHCGEYGETNGRPHYHACLFGFNFRDRLFHHCNQNGDRLYTSKRLDSIWQNGIALIGDVTFESAAYVARYVVKKYSGEYKDEHYLNKSTGEVLTAEYVSMSRGRKENGNGGIGYNWYKKYSGDMYPSDFRILRNKKMLPARYYDEQIKLDNLEMYDIIKERRRSKPVSEDNSLRRLAAREVVQKEKMKIFSREV